MATRGIQLIVPFTVWDTANNEGKTGDKANLTMQWLTSDGGSLAQKEYTSISIIEFDAVDSPGLYYIIVAAVDTDVDIGVMCGKSATANISVMPITIQFERLPDAAPAAVGGVRDLWGISGSSASAVKLKDQIGAIESGLAQTPFNATTIKFENTTQTANLDLTGMIVLLADGTGKLQTRRIDSYVQGTQVATIDRDWDVNPDATSKYHILGLIL